MILNWPGQRLKISYLNKSRKGHNAGKGTALTSIGRGKSEWLQQIQYLSHHFWVMRVEWIAKLENLCRRSATCIIICTYTCMTGAPGWYRQESIHSYIQAHQFGRPGYSYCATLGLGLVDYANIILGISASVQDLVLPLPCFFSHPLHIPGGSIQWD